MEREPRALITLAIHFIATCHNRTRHDLMTSRTILDQMIINSRNDDPDLEALELCGQIMGIYIAKKGKEQ